MLSHYMVGGRNSGEEVELCLLDLLVLFETFIAFRQ